MKEINEKYFINKDKDYSKTEISAILDEDEKILWKDKPRRLSFVLNKFLKGLPLVIIWAIFDSFFIYIFVTQGFIYDGPSFLPIFLIFFFIAHLTPVWIWLYNFITSFRRQKVEEYAFTNKRILVKKGFIGSDIISIYYPSLDGVNLKVGMVEKMCKVGDIYITATNTKVVLEDIKDPYFVSERLQKIANDIKADINYPNDLRPKENHGYKTDYKFDDYFKDDKK